MKPLIVGELNPYGSDPRYALYHLPRHASGNRLREIMGLTDVEYSRGLDKVNLCVGRWSLTAARAACELLFKEQRPCFVLLGKKVCGLNLLWNPPDAKEKARDLLITAGVLPIKLPRQYHACTNCGLEKKDNVCPDCGGDQGFMGGNTDLCEEEA